uniref:Pentacotripeptide-repeat region of PRORP domain-containing protein n=1 Tax=Octactis speculum TaxID=3111310 RepID=A0A7S2F9Y3_9STRA|mmetsp:Transcript_18266/g.24717  ORF Transcript_18266/g.24717 Transcript_18266/m.24717 type:complete len:281 (+) Transcript_18266:2-844(+)
MMAASSCMLTPSIYGEVVRALCVASASSVAARDLLRDPLRVATGLADDMAQHGVALDQQLVYQSLLLFLQTIRNVPRISEELGLEAKSGEELATLYSHTANQALDFFRRCTDGTPAHAAVVPDLRAHNVLLKILCMARDENKALALIGDMETGGKLEPSRETYNIMMRRMVEVDILRAEDIMIRMTNKGIAPDERTMDTFLRAYYFSGPSGASTAISMVQGCFNQFQTRPSISAYMEVIDSLIQNENMPEVSRAAIVYTQLWPDETKPLYDSLDTKGLGY